ncbi:MAG: major tail protein [Ethanoligenens sp.]
MPDTLENPVVGEVVGIDNLYAAQIPTGGDTAAAYTPSTPFILAPVAEIKHDPKGDATLSYYDNGPMFAHPFEGESEETITVSGLSDQMLALLTGKSWDASKGIVYDSGDPIYSPYFAVGYHISIGNGFDKYRWFLKGIFVPSSEDYKTKGEKVDPQSMELAFKPLRTIHQFTYPDPRNASGNITGPLKIVKADTSSPLFTTAANWFNAVQFPAASS